MSSRSLFVARSPSQPRIKRQRTSDSEDEVVARTNGPPTPASPSGATCAGMPLEDPEVPLSLEQLTVVRIIEAGHNVFLTGGAGSGKTALLKAAVKRLQDSGKKVLKCGYTGAAALGLGGYTIHSLLGLDPTKTPPTAWPDSKRGRRPDLYMSDYVAQMSCAKSGDSDQPSDEPFGGVQVIVCGDFHQLPPVLPFQYCFTCGGHTNPKTWRRRVAYVKCPKCHNEEECSRQFAFCAEAWDFANFTNLLLKENHRQLDARLVDALDKVKHCTMDKAGYDVFLNPDDEPRDTEGAVTLAATNRVVNQINDSAYEKLHTREVFYLCHDNFELRPGDDAHAEFGERSADRRTLKAQNFHPYKSVLKLKEGLKVVLTKNVNIELGLVNSSTGVIVGFQPYNEATAPMTRAAVDHSESNLEDATGRPINLRGNASHSHIYRQEQMKEFVITTNRGIDLPIVRFSNGRVITIYPDCALQQLGDESPYSYLSRTQIPLVQGDAMTIHKSQGLTLDKVIVDLTGVFGPAMAYVALSRARSLRGLTVIGTEQDLSKFGPIEEVDHFLRNIQWYEE